MPDPTPVDPEVATALLRSHLEGFFKHSPRLRGGVGWAYEITENPLIAIVHMPARSLDGEEPDIYTLRLDGTYYDTWPVSVMFVEPHEREWRRARFGTPGFPILRGSPGAPSGDGVGFQFALHDEYSWPNGHTDQLICFSYNLGYYTSNHSPNDDQKWRPNKDRVDATLSRIHAALNGPAYLGPSTQANAT